MDAPGVQRLRVAYSSAPFATGPLGGGGGHAPAGVATTTGVVGVPTPPWLTPFVRGHGAVSLLVSSFSDPLSHLLRLLGPPPRAFGLWARLATGCLRVFEGAAEARLVLLDADPRGFGLHGDGSVVAQAPEHAIGAPAADLAVSLTSVRGVGFVGVCVYVCARAREIGRAHV